MNLRQSSQRGVRRGIETAVSGVSLEPQRRSRLSYSHKEKEIVNTSKLRDWLEVIGLFSVVASLIFVGLQMRQTQKIALANHYEERADVQFGQLESNMENGYSILAFEPGSPVNVFTKMTSEDINYAYNLTLHFLYSLDNNHFQYEAGFLPEEHWRGQVLGARALYSRCDARWIWANYRRENSRQSFVEFMESFEDPCSPEDSIKPWLRDDPGVWVVGDNE